MVSIGTSFDQLNAVLATDKLDQTPVYFGDQDMSFYGIKLNFYRQQQIDRDEKFVIIFANPKLPIFAKVAEDATHFYDVGAKVLIVL